MDYLAQSIGDAFPAFDASLSEEEKALLAEGLVDSTQLQRWAAAKIKEYKERIQSLKSVYNAGALINRKLPREVLAEIFSHFHPGYDLHDQEIKLLGVCRLWRHLILRTPVFWANIISRQRHMARDRQLGRLRLFLPLTRAHPLTLWFQGVPPALVSVLTPHASRISSLTVEMADCADLESLNKLLRGGTPLLEHLAVTHSPYPGKTIPTLAISRQNFPRLRSLMLPVESLGEACLDNDLRTLDVFGCVCQACREMKTNTPLSLLEILERCPSLRTLKIQNILHMWGPLDRTVALPALCELEIEEHRGDLGAFLTRMAYPRTCAVYLGTSAHTAIRECLPPEPNSWPQLREADEVRFRVDFHGWSVLRALACGHTRFKLGMFVKTTQVGSLKELSQLFSPSARVTSLKLESFVYPYIRSEDDPTAVFRGLLEAFPHLIRLDIGTYDGRRVMQLLGETSADGFRYCPNLRELRSVWYYGDDELYWPSDAQGTSAAGRPYNTEKWHKAGAVVFSVFCDIAVQLLDRRRAAGKSLKKLCVGVYPEVVTESLYVDTEGWEPSVLKQRLRRRLTGYEDIVHVFPVKVED
ncbi:hypothetical protein OH76DRAFT_133243 [Lentinus brumalis]|uniref:Uncharacterized protein n=1 Tax=Lentinus brumalis TaxID=2498619 RepID=A0A371DK29_9APHY|nr:hypothetical protein OH76DRAFT_133243 [Polyporus brumalis]